ncbi:MAG: GAF domain-containing sensor histidine kinase [Candidatus Omnitrophica bacterium]|nr:GAF domain-containing sensor histidine kinase [Candidatus Omnitrophota bacterium]
MSDPEKPYQAAHEIGRVYDAITDSKVLIEFFLTTVSRFIPSRQSYLFLAARNKTLLLEASVPILINRSEAEIGAVKTTLMENKKEVFAAPSGGEVPPGLMAEAQKVLEEGKPCALKGRMFLPLIARNSTMGVACLERAAEAPAFTPQEVEIGFDLASEFSGALKNILLFEENVKMERLAAVGQAMGMVVHEIKNIMQLARFSDEITRMGLKEKNEEFLATGLAKMTKTLKEMDGFIWEMLSLTKDYQLEPEEVDLAAILAELQSDLTERAEGYHIRLDFKADPGFPAVQGDGRSLYRALLNLVKNAFEAFQDKTGACVKIRARIKDDERYELIVEDNASGMSEEVKAKLFEAFFSTKGKRGTGLGLMVVQRTARMHQGVIHVESQLGMGTRFILTLRRSFPKMP